MDYYNIILGVLGLVVAGGATYGYFKRSEGTETIKLLQINIQAYIDAEKFKDRRIAYLEGQIVYKDETIKRLLHDSK